MSRVAPFSLNYTSTHQTPNSALPVQQALAATSDRNAAELARNKVVFASAAYVAHVRRDAADRCEAAELARRDDTDAAELARKKAELRFRAYAARASVAAKRADARLAAALAEARAHETAAQNASAAARAHETAAQDAAQALAACRASMIHWREAHGGLEDAVYDMNSELREWIGVNAPGAVYRLGPAGACVDMLTVSYVECNAIAYEELLLADSVLSTAYTDGCFMLLVNVAGYLCVARTRKHALQAQYGRSQSRCWSAPGANVPRTAVLIILETSARSVMLCWLTQM